MTNNKVVTANIDGLDYKVVVPESTLEEDYEYGIVIGPPEALKSITLDWDFETISLNLHKELFARGLFTYHDVISRRQDVSSALSTVLKLHAEKIIDIYREASKDGSSK